MPAELAVIATSIHDGHGLLQIESRSNSSTPHMAAIIIIDDPEAGVSRVRNESFFSADATACACYAIAVAFSWPADRFVVGRSRHTWLAHTTSIPVGRSLLAPCHHLSYFVFLFSVILVLCHHIGLMEHFFRRGSSPGPPQPADEGRQ